MVTLCFSVLLTAQCAVGLFVRSFQQDALCSQLLNDVVLGVLVVVPVTVVTMAAIKADVAAVVSTDSAAVVCAAITVLALTDTLWDRLTDGKVYVTLHVPRGPVSKGGGVEHFVRSLGSSTKLYLPAIDLDGSGDLELHEETQHL